MFICGLLTSFLQQLIQFFDQAREVVQGRIDRGGFFHVDAGVAQQVERVFRAAAFEEAQVVVQFALAAADDALGQGDRRRQAGGVLVDVERPIEVRNAEALQRQLVVEREIGAEVAARAARGRSP